MFRRERIPAIVAALAALIVYAVSLAGTYVYDDRYIVQLDPRLQDMHRWGQYWTKDYFNGGADNLYRPLVSMSYAIETKLHGNGDHRAWIFHLINWLLHAAVSAAVAELALRLTRKSTVALIAGLLFAVHPIHVEAVANIVGRAELMCGIGMIAALVLFLRPLSTARNIAIWLCFILALLSKEQGMLLPLLLLLVAPLAPRSERNNVLLLGILLIWTAAGYFLFRERILKFWWDRSFLDPMLNPMVLAHGADRILVPIEMLGRYVALLIAPVKLSFDYTGNAIGSHTSLADPFLVLGCISLVAGLVACIVAIAKRSWPLLFCLLSFGLLWGMVSNLPTIIGINFAERLMYIPSAFFVIVAAIALCRLPGRWRIGLVAIIIALFSLRTVTYAWEWNNRTRFYEYSVREKPDSPWLRIILATEYSDRGEHPRAIEQAAQARALAPDYFQAWICSAAVAMRAGNLDDAMRFAQTAHRIHPSGKSAGLISDISTKMDDRNKAATRPATIRSASSPAASQPSR